MTERVRSQYTNLVKMKLDQRSIKRTRSQIRNFRSEVAKMMKMEADLGLGGKSPKSKSSGRGVSEEYKVRQSLLKQEAKQSKRDVDLLKLKVAEEGRIAKEQMWRRKEAVRSLTSPTGGNKASQTLFADMLRGEGKRTKSPLQDGHVQALRNQEKFNMLQKDSLDSFFESNRLARQMSTAQREKVTAAVKETRNAKQLRLELRRQRNMLVDNLATRKRLTKEAEKQLLVQKRFNSSISQMAGGLASAYLAVSAFTSTVGIGMQMEGMEKSFLVISKDGGEAAETMAWIREESYRLGASLITASKGFASMKAAAGDKMAMDDLKEMFTGIQEAGVALGLSQDDLGGITLAVKQMLSKGKIQAKFIGLSKLH